MILYLQNILTGSRVLTGLNKGGFRYCEAGHCSLHERNGILIDGDKNICKLFEMENVDKWQEAKEKFCKRCRNDLLKNTEELLNILAAYKNERK